MKRLPAPNHTQTPNLFYDDWIKEIDNLAEMKVVQVVIRGTFGWHRDAVDLSLAEIKIRTGMSRASAQTGVKKAIGHGYIERIKKGQSFCYQVAVAIPNFGTVDESAIPKVGTDLYQDSAQSAASPISVLKKGKKQPKPARAQRYMLPPDSMQELTSEDFTWLREKAPHVPNYERATEKWFLKQATARSSSKTLAEWKINWQLYMMNYSDGESGRNGQNGNGRSSERPAWMASEK